MVYKHCVNYDGDEDCHKCCSPNHDKYIFSCPADCPDYIAVHLGALWKEAALNQKPRWIPVTERLPEEMDQSRGEWSAEIRPSDDVLVWLSHEKRQSVAWYSHPYKEWTTVDENTVYCFEEVTYWQPLPQPPKEET